MRTTPVVRDAPGVGSEVEIKGQAFLGIVGAVGEMLGETAIARLRDEAAGELGEALRTNTVLSAGWYPVAWYRELHQAARRVSGGGDAFTVELGKVSLRRDVNMVYKAIFRLLSPTPAGLPHLERCEGHWLFALDRYDAQLACDLSTTSGTARDPRACLWLRLTATGAPGEEEGALLEGLDFGRTTIVRTFRQLMSPAANAYWELARDA